MTHKTFSSAWKGSTQPRKQRKYRHNAPLHHRQKLVHAHLSSALHERYHHRAVQVRVGDKVKILRGEFSKKEGKVTKVDLKRIRIFVAGQEIIRKDGTTVLASFDASNLIITELNLDDKKRKQRLERSKVESKATITSKVTATVPRSRT